MKNKTKIRNYSNLPLIIPFDTHKINYAVFLPDYSPNSGTLPVGCVVSYNLKNHTPTSKLLGQDVGCGMRLIQLDSLNKENIPELTNILAEHFLEHREGLGSLGKGNHFVTFYKSDRNDNLYGLIHAGSRNKGIELFNSEFSGERYILEQDKVRKFAIQNRKTIQQKIEEISKKKTILVLDSEHNYLEVEGENVIYRKGASKLEAGQKHIIPSSMGGNALIVRGKAGLEDTFNSICHGTGRKFSRSEARTKTFHLDSEIMKEVYFPYFLPLDHFSTELPQCYRSIEELKPSIEPFVKIEEELFPLASVMI